MSSLAALCAGASALTAIAAALGAFLRVRTVRCFPLAAGIIVAVLYVAGLADILYVGAAALYVLGVLCAAYCVAAGIRRKAMPEGLATALLCVVCCMAVSYYAHAGRLFGAWDEFSHWGLAARATRETHSLARGAGSVLLFVDYPPATALFAYFMGWGTDAFIEETAFVAQNLLMACAFAPLLADFSIRRPLPLLAAAALGALIPVLINVGAYTEIYVDSLLGVLTGMALACFLARDRQGIDDADFAALLFILTLTKPSGVGLAAIVLLVALMGAGVKRWKGLAAGAGAVLAAKASWSVYMAACGRGASWNIGAIDFTLWGETQKDVLLHFVRAVEERPLLSYWVPVTYLMGMAIFALCGYLLTRIVPAERVRPLWRGFVGVLLGSALYALSMLALYMYVYVPEEGIGLASYERYMATYLQAAWVFLFALAVREGAAVRTRVLIASAVVLCASGDVGKAGYELLTTPITVKQNWAYRACYTPIIEGARRLGEGEKMFIASSVDSPLDWFMARYTAMLPDSALNLLWDCGLAGENALEAQAWMDTLAAEYEYVFLCWTDEAFIQAYGALFEQTPQAHTMYRVDGQRRLLIKEDWQEKTE